MRLCASYAGLVAVCGIVFIALLYLYMRYVPNYELQIRHATEFDPAMVPDSDIIESGPTQPLEIRTADDVLDNILLASAAALAVLVILGGVLGWVMAGRIIRPLATINTAASRAATGRLNHRVSMDGPRDEIRDLSETFDRMLSSLEQSFEAQQRFAANASHELRSPLTTVKTMIDVTLADPEANARELRSLAERIRDVNQSNIDIIEALLDLAGASSALHSWEAVNLTETVAAAVAAHEDEARETGLIVTTRIEDAWVRGDPILLRHALSNLLRNAIQYNRRDGWITVTTAYDPVSKSALITVANSGPIVSAGAIEQLSEPFFRGSGRTVTRGEGHGLGLAIVRAITDAHNGTLSLTSGQDGGLTAEIRLDASAAW